MVRLTLDSVLTQKNMTRYELAKRTGVKFQIIDHYYKNIVVRYDSYLLNKFCEALDCEISDLIKYTRD